MSHLMAEQIILRTCVMNESLCQLLSTKQRCFSGLKPALTIGIEIGVKIAIGYQNNGSRLTLVALEIHSHWSD